MSQPTNTVSDHETVETPCQTGEWRGRKCRVFGRAAISRGAWLRGVEDRRSHHVFARPGIAEQLNLQDRRGQAKPYQLR